jgi:hypothetical protein
MVIYSMFSPIFQRASSDTSGLQWIMALVILVIAWVVLANLNSKTKRATPYSRTITTAYTRDQIVNLTEAAFPKSLISKSFNWQSSWLTADRFALSGYYLTNGQGCLTLLITGIIPGYLAIKFAMERSEQIVIDFSRLPDTGELTLEAQGLRAQREVNRLADKITVKA